MSVAVDIPAYLAFIHKRPRDNVQWGIRLMLWSKYVWSKIPELDAASEMLLLDGDAKEMGDAGWWR